VFERCTCCWRSTKCLVKGCDVFMRFFSYLACLPPTRSFVSLLFFLFLSHIYTYFCHLNAVRTNVLAFMLWMCFYVAKPLGEHNVLRVRTVACVIASSSSYQ
jgi:hypothetical protein